MEHARLFAFEQDFVASLRCIPMAVRLKLDRSGIKLTLRQWSRFTRQDREDLLRSPCETADEIRIYHALLVSLVALRAGEQARPLADLPEPLWEKVDRTPDAVAACAREQGLVPPDGSAWRRLTALQRFALLKLTRENHDNVNFAPAMREFGLAPA